MIRAGLALAAALVLTACGEGAHDDHAAMDHSAHSSATPPAHLNPAQQGYAKVNARMHEGMADIPADADEAFMRGMLAHHRGAVEMSEVMLEHGKDAQARDLAQRIIDAQAAEIAEMEAWLAARDSAQ